MNPKIEVADSFPVSIFIAGDIKAAKQCVREYCDETGFCVTVTPTTYIYTRGQEDGVIVGLINYPRFPSDENTIMNRAIEIGKLLVKEMKQESFSIQSPIQTVWYSYRFDDMTAEDNDD